jgi:uncharacterized tellurite resistance protein B-like protein
MVIRCESCQREYKIPDRFSGIAECPHCEHQATIGTLIKNQCPYCHAKLDIKAAPGAKFRCGNCGNVSYYTDSRKLVKDPKKRLYAYFVIGGIVLGGTISQLFFRPDIWFYSLPIWLIITFIIANVLYFIITSKFINISKVHRGQFLTAEDRRKLQQEQEDDDIEKFELAPSIFVLWVYVAFVDGKINRQEEEIMFEMSQNLDAAFYRAFDLTGFNIMLLVQNSHKIHRETVGNHLSTLRRLLPRDLLASFIRTLFRIALADGQINQIEIKTIVGIARSLKLPENIIDQIKQEFVMISRKKSAETEFKKSRANDSSEKAKKKIKPQDIDIDRAFSIFGLEKNVSFADVHRRYIGLARKYHPDSTDDPIEKKSREEIFKYVQHAWFILKKYYIAQAVKEKDR